MTPTPVQALGRGLYSTAWSWFCRLISEQAALPDLWAEVEKRPAQVSSWCRESSRSFQGEKNPCFVLVTTMKGARQGTDQVPGPGRPASSHLGTTAFLGRERNKEMAFEVRKHQQESHSEMGRHLGRVWLLRS